MSLISLLAVSLAYLVGSIPSGYLAAKLLANVDVTRVGSGRTGGSNVLRAAGVVPAVVTVLADLGKGYAAVSLATMMAPAVPITAVLAGLAVVAGHNWSVFLGFDGGVGTATTLGAALALVPLPAGVSLAAGLAAVAIWRHTSLGSLTLAGTLTLGCIVAAVLGAIPVRYVLFALGSSLMSVWELRPNIARLRRGTERKLGQYIPRGRNDVIPEVKHR